MRTSLLAVWTLVVLAGCAPTVPVTKSAAPPSQPHRLGFRLSGTQVVFEFRPEEYVDVTSGPTAKRARLADLRIHSVAVGGEFNRWSTTALPMALASGAWITAQPIADFAADRPLAFKFVVNGEYWVEPPASALNRATARGTPLGNLMLELHHSDAPPGAAPPR